MNTKEKINVDDLIDEQRGLARSRNRFERVVGSLMASGLLKQRVAALTDAEVGQLMLDYVWNDLNLLEPESVIVEIASERLLHPSSVLVKSHKENLKS